MTNSPVVFRAGTRASALAIVQTGNALARIEALLPGVSFETVTSSSPGDRDRQTDLRDSPGNFFTEDLDRAVLGGDLDCAVHSAKDLPEQVADGLDWCWLPWREDPRDALILRSGEGRGDLPHIPKIGVSSDRREAWCCRFFPKAKLLPIRGNIEERLAQLDAGDFDLVIMAAAALRRLGLDERITELIPLSELPVPDGQGYLALTFRSGDERFAGLRSLFVKPVTFVGASVGSADLCTVAGVDALEHCDICLHDTLMAPELLDRLPKGSRRIDVGKRSGAHSVPQQDTTEMILEYARRGLRVVRLKGGDPCVFGRLAEEVEALDKLQLPYRVVPGISSLSVMGASTGILMTRRGFSNGFTVMSGRKAGGVTAEVGSDARAKLPLVFFMSLSVLGKLLEQLKASGVGNDTPAAVVLEAGSPTEEVLRGSVGNIVELLEQKRAERSATPAGLAVIGEVARFGFSREWGALSGRRVLLTCSEALQPESRRLVLDAGGIPVSLPLITLTREPAVECLKRCEAYDWLVVTSPSAVRCLFDGLRAENQDLRKLPRIMACGPGTLRELKAAGIIADAVSDEDYGGVGILAIADKYIKAGERVLRVRSDVAGPALADALREMKAEVDDVCLYRNDPVRSDALPDADVIFFASSSAVRAFVDNWGVEHLEGKTILAIGKPTAKALEAIGVTDMLVGAQATVASAIETLAADCVMARIIG